ncbi:MAG: class I SAM-dependent methyltransferase [Chitinispirillia bacterium]|nr:class I SAM-dependent methyltransferase [Chitinispirillia bacterium]MCL2267887.1 class I SAM-dependent methyltransferase [Chitinispirillia bacterium]
MGITAESFGFLRYCRSSGADFESTCQIGRQNVFFSSKECGIKHGDFAEPLFRSLGAKSVESMDYSDYEGAGIIHDMNLPIPEDMKERFSAVIESGTLEHVFNYPVAIKNCMQMVKPGGYLIIITPSNNWFGHGFYQFSPELFYTLLNEQNGFAETQVLTQDDSSRWYKIREPREVKGRVDVCCAKNTLCSLYVVSKKNRTTPENLAVFQSDYVETWKDTERKPELSGGMKSAVKRFIRKIVPVRAFDCLNDIRKSMRGEGKKVKTAGKARFYEKIRLS